MKIVLSVVLAVLIVGCSDEKGSQKSVQEVQAPQSVTKAAAPVKPVQADVVVADTTQKIEKTVVKPKETTVAKVKEVVKTPAVKVDGAKLFTVCSSCHGAHAEKKALGKSQIIKGWSEAKIITALQGYKNGTYGGAMKAVMKGQAAKLSDTDIKALAEYISQL